ncbi:Protein RALF-like 31 [Linum perenne]
MVNPSAFLLILSLSLFLLHPSSPICNGSSVPVKIGSPSSFIEEQEELEMESEVSRRMLMMQRRYISYATLKRDMVPCDNPGASYYDCHRSRPANTYHRGCEVITRCARDVSDFNG